MRGRLLFTVTVLAAACAGPAWAENCDEALRELERGAKHQDGSREEEAAFRKAAELCPKMADSHYNLGLSLLKQHRLDEAQDSLEKAVALSHDANYYVALGNIAFAEGKDEKAREHYEAALKADAQNVRALQGLAACAVKKGEYQTAEEQLRQAIQFDPRDARLFFNLGVVLEALKRPEEAATSYQASIGRQSNFIPAYLALGALHTKMKKWPQAEKILRNASLLEPDNGEILLALSAYYETKEDYDQALEMLQSAKDRIGSVEYLRRRGVLLIKTGEADAGMAELLAAQKEAPADAAVVSALGWAALKLRRLDEAERFLRRAVEMNEGDSFAHNNLGVLLETQGNREDAKKQFARARELDAGLEQATKNWQRMNER